ncbi:leucine-rich repeat-containing protein 45 [Bombina bombina]|uniref:leucine-rich repeat-containing protein 45 n=1 Tax=Bombina bombina TaxID=8345 RepID=UPI00235ADC47|nr:leucine-rich repeat-containing protein 45 [Bombina bombina]
MEEFRRMYLRLCQERQLEPQSVLRDAAGDRLDLSAQSLSPDTCQILGTLLQNDVTFTGVLLSDCMLSDDGLKPLLQGLATNAVIKHLDMKGNNLQAEGAKTIGKLLRRNSSLTSLTLEWNNLGMWEQDFSLLCDGLAYNQTLRKLDLRNNQINHKGAEELANALRRNFTLQELDLRWNNIGLLGGRAILSCLEANRSLQKIHLSGNNIPSDILKAIDQGMEHNQERQSIRQETVNQRQILTKEVQNLKEEKNKQFLSFMETIDKHKEQINHSSRTSTLQMRKLQETLEERKSVVNSLTAKLQMNDAALALSQQKVQGLGELLTQVRQENVSSREKQDKEQRKEREEFAEREAKLRRDLNAANEKNLNYRSKVDELERRCKMQQDLLFELKQELTNTSSELKLRAIQAEERLGAEKKRFRQLLDDANVLHQKEVDHLKQHMGDSERAAEERMQRLEAVRVALEEELSKLKVTLANERAEAKEEIQTVRSATQIEEQQHAAVLQDKLRLLMQSRDQTQSQVLQQNQLIEEQQSKNGQLSLEIETLKRRIDGLNQELARKDQEKVSEVTKVRVEMQEQIGHMEAELATQDGFKEKISALERQQKVQASYQREMMLDKDGEISSLKEKLRLKEAEIARIREEDAQRASMLQNAILTYIHSSPLGAAGGRN